MVKDKVIEEQPILTEDLKKLLKEALRDLIEHDPDVQEIIKQRAKALGLI